MKIKCNNCEKMLDEDFLHKVSSHIEPEHVSSKIELELKTTELCEKCIGKIYKILGYKEATWVRKPMPFEVHITVSPDVS
jgi:hypothetical protein